MDGGNGRTGRPSDERTARRMNAFESRIGSSNKIGITIDGVTQQHGFTRAPGRDTERCQNPNLNMNPGLWHIYDPAPSLRASAFSFPFSFSSSPPHPPLAPL
ncbi:hypothetical protein EVAR_5756_1 [Eumeta japonica]|uniref:Uncharacterized protein n=1 Tax=Eumeta variegata TaxID=151549 RepID=A0A4C1T7R1_EUMVA|nr:hypothetical protein EVAR_5756_1 [Eumeta japonica]